MNPAIDLYLLDGCGRCKHYKTPACKVHNWPEELKLLRMLAIDSGLTEELKWSMPCYTYKGKNVALIAAFKDYCCISFFKGSLLNDPEQLLEFAGGNSHVAKMLKFTNTDRIYEIMPWIKQFLAEATEAEKQGKKTSSKAVEEYPVPEELIETFNKRPDVKAAFYSLTAGRQRAYLIHFNAPKQSETRISRIEKSIPMILEGKGLNDDFQAKRNK